MISLERYYELRFMATSWEFVPPDLHPTSAEEELAERVRAAMLRAVYPTPASLEIKKWWEEKWSPEAVRERDRELDRARDQDPSLRPRMSVGKAGMSEQELADYTRDILQRDPHAGEGRLRVLRLDRYGLCVTALLGLGIPPGMDKSDKVLLAQHVLYLHQLLSDEKLEVDGEPYGGSEPEPGEICWGSRAWAYALLDGATRSEWHSLVEKALKLVDMPGGEKVELSKKTLRSLAQGQAISMIINDDHIKPQEVADIVGVSRGTLYDWEITNTLLKLRSEKRGSAAGRFPRGAKTRSGDIEATTDQ